MGKPDDMGHRLQSKHGWIEFMEQESSGFIGKDGECFMFSCPLAVIRNGGRSSGVFLSESSLLVILACSIEF